MTNPYCEGSPEWRAFEAGRREGRQEALMKLADVHAGTFYRYKELCAAAGVDQYGYFKGEKELLDIGSPES